ncbi:MAG: heat-shock protein Hsp20 [Ignavibacteriae bacterium]|nr:heat-shock protein Hsp20 [Ignavibacteriota bacterium]|tara:strand:+ start:219 stop:620 length:402 start_codon:yes stop_codon:yes gene_type:complete
MGKFMTDLKSADDEKVNSWDYALEHETWITPTIDIFESDDNFTVIAKMPGVERENLKIKLEDGNLVIMGRIDYDNLINKNYVLKESEIGNYYRKLKLSKGIDLDKIDAQLTNGQLLVLLPKQSGIKPKSIEIQ